MIWEVRFLITLFAIMFFWIASEEAFANVVKCFESGGVIRCIQPDGTMTTIIRS